jgi:hypothetical protein
MLAREPNRCGLARECDETGRTAVEVCLCLLFIRREVGHLVRTGRHLAPTDEVCACRIDGGSVFEVRHAYKLNPASSLLALGQGTGRATERGGFAVCDRDRLRRPVHRPLACITGVSMPAPDDSPSCIAEAGHDNQNCQQ